MKEKALKLLNSGNMQDILIGINVSFFLPVEEFLEIFSGNTKYSYKENTFIRFRRGDIDYHLSSYGTVYTYSCKGFTSGNDKYYENNLTRLDWINAGSID